MKIGSVIFGNPFIFRKNYEGACFFLEVGFVCADTEWVKRADMFRQQFEELLRDTVQMSNGRIHRRVLVFGELVTEFTIPAEKRTE